MSRMTKRKHVAKEVLEDFILPQSNQVIVQVASSRGNNLHEVTTPEGAKFLVSMPTKFRKNIWIKKGDYLLIDPVDEGDRVKGEIASVLYKDQIEFLKEEKIWPSEFIENDFNNHQKLANSYGISDDWLPDSDEEDSGCINVNHPSSYATHGGEQSDSDDDETTSEDEESAQNSGGER